MTPHDELTLYHTDRTAWAHHVAPRWRDMLRTADPEQRAALWALAGPELRTALRQLRDAAAR